ncbi:MAG: cell division protein FtsK, partial [Gammaproteobacteria bacterium]|nr:cell division protein FtsK [Gammaproteobacteria bacterium]
MRRLDQVARARQDIQGKSGDGRRVWRESLVLLVVPVLLYLLACLVSYSPEDPGWSRSGSVTGPIGNFGGVAGAYFADIMLSFFGIGAYLLPFLLGYVIWLALRGREQIGETALTPALRLIGVFAFLVAVSGLAHLNPPEHFATQLPVGAGGLLGQLVSDSLQRLFGYLGAALFAVTLLLVGITLATGLSWFTLMDRIGRAVLALLAFLRGLLGRTAQDAEKWRATRAVKAEREETRREEKIRRAKREPVRIEPPPPPVQKSDRAQRETQIPLFAGAPSREGGLPPLSLLDDPKPQPKGYSDEALETLSRQIEFKLKDFRIEGQVVGVYPGPVVTRFEMEPAPGVKGSQVSSLDKDIARGLSVKSVRVVDVIPGKSVIGLEIPNANREIIFLSEILRSKEYDKAASPLTLALGKDIGGRPTVADLARMPHLLVAGTTGSGKSVAVNAMVLSLLYKSSARDVRMLMIDPKMLELSVYEGIPHLLAPVVTDMKEAANGLRWCVAEMERRYKLMSAVGVRNLAGFNKKVKDAIEAGQPLMDPLFKPNPELDEVPRELETLPYIVVIIDEFADMMMIVGKKVEELIARLAQKARAAGIHLILATQRPSVDVITGLIKANIPTRVAFQVSSKIDSRTILDQSGAETLLGHGDMLYLPPGTAMPERLHGAFVSDDEVHRVV